VAVTIPLRAKQHLEVWSNGFGMKIVPNSFHIPNKFHRIPKKIQFSERFQKIHKKKILLQASIFQVFNPARWLIMLHAKAKY
jgi:hypothetical protein